MMSSMTSMLVNVGRPLVSVGKYGEDGNVN
jgi:hypothetical protein